MQRTGSATSVPEVAGGAKRVLEVRGASKRRGSRTVLDDVSLSVHAGEIYALIGPNGAGKTTLVRAICRRLALDAGLVQVEGEDPVQSPSARRKIGLVPQEIALWSELTGRENLEILARLAGVEGDVRPAVEEALRWTGLSERADDVVSSLSGGMQRRLNLAAATMHRPDLLLLDEPTVGIDPQAREEIHTVLRGLRSRGTAILLTTHDLEQAEELADRVGMLIEGHLELEGSPAELVAATFGDNSEVRLTLTRAPTEAHQKTLDRQGLVPTRESTVWAGPLASGLEGLEALSHALAATGIEVGEFRVRDPGLRSLFLRLTGSEL